MVEVMTRLYAELAQSYKHQALITFLGAVCMAKSWMDEIKDNY